MVRLMVYNSMMRFKVTISLSISIFIHLNNKTQAQKLILLLVELDSEVKGSQKNKCGYQILY